MLEMGLRRRVGAQDWILCFFSPNSVSTVPGHPLPALQKTPLKQRPPPRGTSGPLLPVPLPGFLSESKGSVRRGAVVCAQHSGLSCPMPAWGLGGRCVRHSGETWAVLPTFCCHPACPLGPQCFLFLPPLPVAPFALVFALSRSQPAPFPCFLPSRGPFSVL